MCGCRRLLKCYQAAAAVLEASAGAGQLDVSIRSVKGLSGQRVHVIHAWCCENSRRPLCSPWCRVQL